MAYRIQYEIQEQTHTVKTGLLRPFLLTMISFLLFVILVGTLWPDGFDWMKENIFMQNQAVVVLALNEFEDGLRNGYSLLDTFKHFLRTIIQ